MCPLSLIISLILNFVYYVIPIEFFASGGTFVTIAKSAYLLGAGSCTFVQQLLHTLSSIHLVRNL